MLKTSVLAAAMLAYVAVGSVAFAADQNNNGQDNAAQQRADKDFGKVSQDGFAAMHDVSMARWAIFNGDTNDAKLDIQKASAALGRARNDDTVFMKAESDLKAPPGVTQPNPKNEQPNTQAVKWLPVDGAMAIAEDYTASPAKTASVAKANAQLKSGDKQGAMDTLKLAGVDVSFDEAVVPLKVALDGVSKAETLLDSGQFYEANQQLKGVQDAIRYDVADYTGTPEKHADNSQAKNAHMAANDQGR
jgi:hypothetical protein